MLGGQAFGNIWPEGSERHRVRSVAELEGYRCLLLLLLFYYLLSELLHKYAGKDLAQKSYPANMHIVGEICREKMGSNEIDNFGGKS